MCPPADVTLLSHPNSPAAAWRAFGQLCDLDIAFDQTDRPRLVSTVLEACAPTGVTPSHIWAMPLAQRIGGLLSIWAAGTGMDQLDVAQPCPAGCGTDLELPLPVAALLEMAQEAIQTPQLELDHIILRRPTGEDQRQWKKAAPRNAETTILADLVVKGTPDDLPALAEHLADFDPLTCFSMLTTCPECEVQSSIPLDIEAHVLALLAREQAHLFREIDVLARRYGWRDSDIMAMPAARRRRYLRIVEQEGGL